MEDDNWDLQAVVRGSCGRAAAAAASSDPLSSFFPSLQQVEAEDNLVPLDDLCPFIPDLLPTTTYAAFEELDEFCKPFFHKSPLPQHLHQQQQAPVPISPRSRRTIASSSSPSPIPLLPDGPLLPSHPNRPPPQTTPRSKRRKNQQKKVVCHVPADGLSSDKWAWRKYGQKPIKGSPYPRGYYRCSSSKGCLARKQVERSRTDPAIFVITYTAEHNHPVPTHRNSLAGSTRNKFPQPSASSQVNAATEGPIAPDLSPRTPLTASMDDDFLLLQPKREEVVDYDEGEVGEEDDDGILLVSEMDMAGDDQVLFVGLDHELPRTPSAGGGNSDEFQGAFSSAPWVASSEAAVAGGS